MKFILNILYILIAVNFSYAQINITDPDNDQSNPIDCASYTDETVANFFDDGGAGGNYSSNINDTITICPDLPNGPKIRVKFATTGNLTWGSKRYGHTICF